MPLEGPHLKEFESLLVSEPYQGVRTMAKSLMEMGFEKGEAKGLEKAHRLMVELLQTQLEDRFGPLTAGARERLESWPMERLTELGRALLKAKSPQELGLDG